MDIGTHIRYVLALPVYKHPRENKHPMNIGTHSMRVVTSHMRYRPSRAGGSGTVS